MNNQLGSLLQLIEELRQEMNNITTHKKLIDQDVLALSRKLDRLLNEYYGLVEQQKKQF